MAEDEAKEISKEERFKWTAGKYQIIVEDPNGKRVSMQHPYETLQEAKDEVGKINQRHPEKIIMNGEDVYIQWCKLNIFKIKMEYPYSCDYSTSYYEEFTP